MAGVVHISEEDAAKNFGALMRHIRLGDEVRLDCKDGTKAVFKRSNGEGAVIVRTHDEAVGGPKKLHGMPSLHAEPEAATMALPAQSPGSTIVEILESLWEWEASHGELRVDEGFAHDVAEAHERFNRPLDPARWISSRYEPTGAGGATWLKPP